MTGLRMLITGASGLLGRWVAHLGSHSFQVLGTYHTHPIHLPRVETIPLDLRDEPRVHQVVHTWQPHIIIHTAVYIGDEETMEAVIVRGTEHLARAAAAVRARLIHLSTDLVFDGETGWYREEDPPRPIMPYGQAKTRAETIVQALVADAVIVRTSLICHLNPPDPRTQWIVDSAREGKPITLFEDEYRTPVWVSDLAAALLELATHPYRGILHLAGPQRLSRYELGIRMAQALGVPVAGIGRGRSRESGLIRPLDASLNTERARRLLRTPLHSIDDGLADPGISRRPAPILKAHKKQGPEPGGSGPWHTTPGGERSK